MRKKMHVGYHIAQSIVNPQTKYLGENGDFVNIQDALYFFSANHAIEYAKENQIELKEAHNVIIPCECAEIIREKHPSSGY